MSFLYLISILIFLATFIIGVFIMRYFKNILVTNILFCASIFVCYSFIVLIAYLQNGLYDWNFINALPTANISPFMFCISPIFFLLPKKIRKYFSTLIALLVVGMILSPIASCVNYFIVGYKFHPSFLIDFFAHILFALWGVYLYQSKQCELTIKSSLIGGSIIVSAALIMLILNVIFDQSFFGLSLNDKHSIYNVRLVENSYLSALIYFSGLIAILIAGFFFQKAIIVFNKNQEK